MLIPGASTVRNAAITFATEYRGWFVIFFVLPISLAFDLFFALRARFIMSFFSAPNLHEERVAHIQKQVREWSSKNDGTKLCTARGGWQSISPGYRKYKSTSTQIEVSLYDILMWSEEEKTVTVEPMVNMGQLSHYLIPKGYTLPVLPEMDDLTVGGLYMGVGIETSSHKYGLFNDSVISAELVLASGEVVTCGRNGPNKDLFDALPWSYGTLGFLTSVTIRIVPCKQYVAVQYIPCSTQSEGIREFRRWSEEQGDDTADFVEALSYSKDTMVVMPAYFCDKKDFDKYPNASYNALSWWYKPWFYKHVGWMLDDNKGSRWEIIPLRDYFHRHTKSIFWELEQIIPVGNHPIFRFLLGWAVPPKVSFLKLTQTETLQKMYEEQHVIQDMLVPISEMDKSLNTFENEYGLYPLWICPYRAYDYGANNGDEHRCFLRKPNADSEDPITGEKYEMYVDLGAYGIPKAVLNKEPFDAVASGRAVESFVMSVRGFQMLYADTYLTKDECELHFFAFFCIFTTEKISNVFSLI
jgi:delta24-sterol reductase